MPASAALIAGGASIAGSVISGAMQSSAISGAADTANANAEKTAQLATGYYAPYRSAGETALTSYSNLLGLGGTDAASTAMKAFQASPGYAYQKAEGISAIDAGAASKGLLHSGSTIKAEQTYGDYLANQDYSNYLTRLSGLTNTGLTATSGLTNAITGQANNIQNTTVSAGGTQASIYGNTASGIGSAVGTAYKNGLFGNTGSTGAFDVGGTANFVTT